jgi:hypothetical protein
MTPKNLQHLAGTFTNRITCRYRTATIIVPGPTKQGLLSGSRQRHLAVNRGGLSWEQVYKPVRPGSSRYSLAARRMMIRHRPYSGQSVILDQLIPRSSTRA